jgi:hypothetical protein
MPKAEKKDAGEYEVGYGKPPKRTQFKPGQRANPRGRGKAPRNPASRKALDMTLLEVLNEPVTVRDAKGKASKHPKIKVAVMAVLNEAMKGDVRALIGLMSLVRRNKLGDSSTGGVLIVPGMATTPEEIAAWEKRVDEHQAPYRGNTGVPAPGDDDEK